MLSLICGQKYKAWMSVVVCSTSGWLAHLESWHSLMTSFRRFPHPGTKSQSPLVRRMPSSCQNRLVLPSRAFPNKSFASESTRSNFNWLMLSVANKVLQRSWLFWAYTRAGSRISQGTLTTLLAWGSTSFVFGSSLWLRCPLKSQSVSQASNVATLVGNEWL